MGPPPKSGPRGPPPPPRPPPPPGPPGPPGLPVAPLVFAPKPKVLVRRRFSTKWEGPVPLLMGRIRSGVAARSGRVSNVPSGVHQTFALVGLCTDLGQIVDDTNPGRSLKIESPFSS